MTAVRPARPSTLGIWAFVIVAAGITLGGILLFIAGQIAGPVTAYVNPDAPAPAIEDLPAEARRLIDDASAWFSVGMGVFGFLALWGAIQGVTAFVRRQGRRWAVAAIAAAVVGYLIVTSAQQFGAALTAVPYAG